MPFDPAVHHRRSIRRLGFDYAANAAYFVTICAHNRSCLFGEILGGKMVLNAAGQMVAAVWEGLANSDDGIQPDALIVMPNHFHGVLFLRHADLSSYPLTDERRTPHGTAPQSLGRSMQAFKSKTTHDYIKGVHEHGWRRFSGHVWQRDYFDHVIRTDGSLERIREYIQTNPMRWLLDAENPTGSGADDVRLWVTSLASQEIEQAMRVKRSAPVAPGDERGVRPSMIEQGADCGSGRRRTQGSPLQESKAEFAEQQRQSSADDRNGLDNADVQTQRTTAIETIPPGSAFRIGHGYDLHRLQAGGRLMLGGIEVSRDISPVAHSDGDVVLHALVDAMLGAMGWGDIGEMFPNTDACWKDAASHVFVDAVFVRVREAGYELGNVDVTILAERPKLKTFKPEIAAKVARMLLADVGRVNIKAGTNEGCDAIGRGEAIAAHAVVLLTRRQ